MTPQTRSTRRLVALLTGALLMLSFMASAARAGSYVVAQCSARINAAAPDAGFSSTTNHYVPLTDCNKHQAGMRILHNLQGGAGTRAGAYGRWVWTAPAGTYITGGNIVANLRNGGGNGAALIASPDTGSPSVFAVGSADAVKGTFSIPLGNWRYFLGQLGCAAQAGNRCGAGRAAHAYIRQMRLQLTDVSPPSLTIGGSMFSGSELRGPQAVDVSAIDQGAGLERVGIDVNGTAVQNDEQPCSPLPGGLTSRLQPCALTLDKSYTLDTALPPFTNGQNVVQACVFDYTQSEAANSDCASQTVLVNNLCPGSSVGGGRSVTAFFAGNRSDVRRTEFGGEAEIRGRVIDGDGNDVPGAKVCVQERSRLPGSAYALLGTTTTDPTGHWTYTIPRGSSRQIRVGYRDASYETGTELSLIVSARAKLQLSRKETRSGRRIYFIGRIAGPAPGQRVVVIHGTVPGAKRQFLIRRARTDGLGGFRVGYRFDRVAGPTKFEFWAEVPVQQGYPYARGSSAKRYVSVRP